MIIYVTETDLLTLTTKCFTNINTNTNGKEKSMKFVVVDNPWTDVSFDFSAAVSSNGKELNEEQQWQLSY